MKRSQKSLLLLVVWLKVVETHLRASPFGACEPGHAGGLPVGIRSPPEKLKGKHLKKVKNIFSSKKKK